MWQDDPLFHDGLDDSWNIEAFSTPAFRLCGIAPVRQAHPFDHMDAYRELFDIFRPTIEQRAERLLMIEKPGARERRRKTIKPEDFQPFDHMKSVIPNDDGFFIGFQFQSGSVDLGTGDASENIFDRGPTKFHFWVGGVIQLDISVSVEDWKAGVLDVERLKAVLLRLPLGSAMGGYGLSLSEDFGNQSGDRLLPIAHRFPALDLSKIRYRAWSANREHDLGTYWIAGINWLTFVGEPFLAALGGADAITRGLPAGIILQQSECGVLFQLGDRPITGEKGQDDDLLPLYHALGERLKPKDNGHPSAKHPRVEIFGPELAKESLLWERRFYDGDWFKGSAA